MMGFLAAKEGKSDTRKTVLSCKIKYCLRLMRLGCFFGDSILCLHGKPDGCEEFGRIKIILPGLVNDPDLVMTVSLLVGYLLV
jgi:hypothetical protein